MASNDDAVAEIAAALAPDPEQRRELARDLYVAQYARLTDEISQQVARRDGITRHVFTLLGTAFTLTVGSLTVGRGINEPLIGLYGATVAALLVPVLMLWLFAGHQHADLRAGQLAWWVRTHHEPLLPAGVGWDTHRREHFPDRPWLRSNGHPALSQPRNLQRWATRILIAVVDGLALLVGAGALLAAVVVDPGWTVAVAAAAGPLVVASAAAAVVTWRVTQHARR